MIILRYSQIYFLYIFFQSIGHNRSDKKKRGGVDLYVSEPQPHDYGVMTVHFPYISGKWHLFENSIWNILLKN